jgi:hypothetical protein
VGIGNNLESRISLGLCRWDSVSRPFHHTGYFDCLQIHAQQLSQAGLAAVLIRSSSAMTSHSPQVTSIGPKYLETQTWAIERSEWHDKALNFHHRNLFRLFEELWPIRLLANLPPYDFTPLWWDERAMPAKFSYEVGQKPPFAFVSTLS